MKIKNLKQFFSAWFVAFTLVFTSLGFFQTALAACTYGVVGPRVREGQTVNKISSIRIIADVTRTGSAGDCSVNNGFVVFYAQASYTEYTSQGSPISYTQLELGRTNFNFGSASKTEIWSDVNLATVDWSKIPNQNQLNIFARVFVNSKNETTSGTQSIKVTGASGGPNQSGVKNIYIALAKSTYSKGDSIRIQGTISDITNLKDVDIVTKVNNKVIGEYPQSSGVLMSNKGTVYQDTTVLDTNGFVNGSNSVTISLYISGSGKAILFAQGSGQFEAQGLSNTGGGGATAKIKNGVKCVDSSGKSSSSVCESNFCDNSTGTCESCQDYDGNVCGTGYTCSSSGVCLSTSAGAQGGGDGTIGSNAKGHLYNPLPEDDLTHAFLLVLQGLLGFLGVLAVVFVVVGGVQMVVAAGNEEAIAKAKKTITYAVIGLVIAILSFSMIAVVQELLQADIVPSSSMQNQQTIYATNQK